MSNKARSWGCLGLGFGLLIASQTRWGVGALAWVAPAPLLAALRIRPGWRFRAWFFGLSLLAWTVATLKIVTPPVPAALSFAFGVPLAIIHFPPYLLWDRLIRRGQDLLAIFAFAAATAVVEWMQAELTPLGVWGSAPGTQVGSLAVLQLLALGGMPGLSFLMNIVAASVEAAFLGRLPRRFAIGLTAATALGLTWGAFRAVRPIEGPEVRAAMIRTDATMGGLPIPDAARRHKDNATLFARTEQAAKAGAQLIVWPEASNLIMPEEEAAHVQALSQTAKAQQVELVVSYIMPVSLEPLLYENRGRWFAPDGNERLSYLKYHPVPGEPAVKGQAPAPTLQTVFGPATAAICYDFDFPALGRHHARAGAGVVALPSSDWRGIDPIHTEMAAMRAIEGGFSIVRSTRFGLSAGIDAHGRLRGQQSTNESTEPYLLASVPTTRIPTLYVTLGNWVLVPLFGLLLWAVARLLRRRPTQQTVATQPRTWPLQDLPAPRA